MNFRIKVDENGYPTKYKSRLEAKEYLQQEGVDIFETYAPFANLSTIRFILAIGMKQNYIFHQLNVKTTFLHGYLKDDVQFLMT